MEKDRFRYLTSYPEDSYSNSLFEVDFFIGDRTIKLDEMFDMLAGSADWVKLDEANKEKICRILKSVPTRTYAGWVIASGNLSNVDLLLPWEELKKRFSTLYFSNLSLDEKRYLTHSKIISSKDKQAFSREFSKKLG